MKSRYPKTRNDEVSDGPRRKGIIGDRLVLALMLCQRANRWRDFHETKSFTGTPGKSHLRFSGMVLIPACEP